MAGKAKWVMAAACVGVAAIVVLSLVEQGKHRYEVCVEYRGRTHCAKAAGATPEQAIRAGQNIGCALITSGRDENMACLSRAPVSARRIEN